MSEHPSEYYLRCAKMVEELRAMLGHGYGVGDFEHMTSIIKARNAQWDKLERDFYGELLRFKAEIMPLQWRVFCSRSGNSEAKTRFGEYVIQSETDGWCLYRLNEDDAHAAYSTLDQAKAAAQSDYEERINSSLALVSLSESRP